MSVEVSHPSPANSHQGKENRIAFLFPGQGSQTIGMGKEIFDRFQVARDVFQNAKDILGWDVEKICFEGPIEKLQETRITQPAILTVSLAILAVLDDWGVKPSVALGHSLGEFGALYSAGVFQLRDVLMLVAKRGELMAKAGDERPGTMLAILGAPDKIPEQVCDEVRGSGVLAVANYNSPVQVVISGETHLVEEAGKRLKEKGAKRVIPLAVSGAFHTALMDAACAEFQGILQSVLIEAPKFPVISNVSAEPYTDVSQIRELLPRQIISPVRFTESLHRAATLGTTTFIEVGPGTVLSGLAKKTLPQARTYSVQDAATLRELLVNFSPRENSSKAAAGAEL